MLANRGFALTFEMAIQQGELPGWRRLFCQDTVAAAEEAQIAGNIGHLVQARQARTDAEIDMAQIVMLRAMKADTNRTGIAFADFEIDIAHRGIECTRIGVSNVGIGWHAAWWREGHAAGIATCLAAAAGDG